MRRLDAGPHPRRERVEVLSRGLRGQVAQAAVDRREMGEPRSASLASGQVLAHRGRLGHGELVVEVSGKLIHHMRVHAPSPPARRRASPR